MREGDYQAAIGKLQHNRQLHPTNQAFDLDVWKGFLGEFGSIEVRQLSMFGERLFLEMQCVRERLSELDGRFPLGVHRGHQCLVFANAYLDGVERRQQNFRPNGFLADFVAAGELEGVQMNLRPTMGALVEAVFDSLRLPLIHYARDSDKKRGRLVRRVTQYPEIAEQVNRLAALYNNYEYLWGLVVWRGWMPVPSGNGFHLHPTREGDVEKIAVAQHLNEVAKVQAAPGLMEEWSRLPESARLSLVPPRARIRLDGSNLKISWDWKSRETRFPSLDVLDQRLIDYRGIDGVVSLAKCAQDLSAREALRFRSLLREIGFGIQRRYRDSERPEALSIISATIARGELCRAIREVTKWSVEKTIASIELFTLRSPRSEVWFQPLVDLGGGRLGFALHPMCHATSVRTAEWLLSNDQAKEGQKGFAFEQEVFESFQGAIMRNDVIHAELRDCLKTTNSVGDIDLFLRFGSIIFVIECKCVVYPSCSNDFYNRERIIEKASGQALRKAAYVTQNWVEFARRYSLKDSTLPRAIIPLVLVSGNEYVGTRLSGDVAVVSRESLAGVLSNYAPTVSSVNLSGAKFVRPPALMFNSAADGEAAMLNNIADPSLIEFYRPYIRSDSASYLSVMHEAAEFSVSYADVVFDAAAQQHFIDRESLQGWHHA